MADFDTASSESDELDDFTWEDGEESDSSANDDELATNSDTSAADLGDGLELDNALS